VAGHFADILVEIADGFDMYLQDAGGSGRDALAAARDRLLAAAVRDPRLSTVRQNALEDQAQFRINVDQSRAGALGVGLVDINAILGGAWAGSYVNDFIDRGQIKPVYVQADAPFRMQPQDINRWYARNAKVEMVPFSAFTSTAWSYGPAKLDRFNGVSAVEIQGSSAEGVSSGAALDIMEQMVGGLGSGFTAAWAGLSYQERLSGSQAPALYAISVIVVFGALLAAWLFGQSNDIYFKVGLLTTIGLAAKNAILIVEFARELQAAGRDLVDAILEAARLRLRPIVMTSLAFVLGVTPLATATGAASGAQNSIGIGVMGGMIAATLLGVFFVPLFFVMVAGLVQFVGRSRTGWGTAQTAHQP
jgi:multidrug efflux pump subunit AcrB